MGTIGDVARAAGVSVGTVSNVLNGRVDRMSADTRRKVQAAIESLGYVPNRVARHLKTGHASLFGLLVPSVANPMWGVIAREIETAAQERHGYRVLLGNTYRDARKETSFFDDLQAHGVRGVVVVSSLADESHLESAGRRGMVVVSYDRRAIAPAQSGIDHVSVDNVLAARIAANHLIGHGHRRLAFVTAAGDTMSRRDKIAGFRATAAEAGLGDAAQVIAEGTASGYGDAELFEAGRHVAARLAGDPARPTGLVAVNDMMALGLVAGFRDAGLEVPADVSVVGMDDVFLAALASPPLTSIRLPLADMAARIVERLIARMAEPGIAAAEYLFAPTLVERRSVAPPQASGRSS
jgi:DNA-binding LacI/PurR family transcriptional regulator